MRFTWGHAAIAIPTIIAIVFTTVLIKAISLKGRAELVVDDYYAKEIGYQKNIDDTQNGQDVNLKLELITTPILGITLSADKSLAYASGSLNMFRPSNKQLDFEMNLVLDSAQFMKLPESKLQTGAYQIQIQMEVDGQSLYIEQNVFIP